MPSPRFFQYPIPLSGPVALEEQESRHASNVLRLKIGDAIVLFDGCGGEADATISSISKRSVSAEVVKRTDTNRELPRPMDIVIALPKGDRQKTLVDGLVQLGVNSLTPLVTERGVAQPTGSALSRLERAVLESCKQCGRNRTMEIRAAIAVDKLAQPEDDWLKLFAHPYGPTRSLSDISNASSAEVAIGPEGGFSDSEVAYLSSIGWTQVSLGPRILRIEMAAIQMAAWWASGQP